MSIFIDKRRTCSSCNCLVCIRDSRFHLSEVVATSKVGYIRTIKAAPTAKASQTITSFSLLLLSDVITMNLTLHVRRRKRQNFSKELTQKRQITNVPSLTMLAPCRHVFSKTKGLGLDDSKVLEVLLRLEVFITNQRPVS